MMTITVLNRETSEKIAAGEVIERPASVVKELLDNAIDASATRITVEILQGGKEYMKISDNGRGITYQELPIAFLRHATSKIAAIDDLESLSTLGFRGEALPSIAAVAKVKMVSKLKEQLAAGEIEFQGGEKINYQENSAADGTSVIVENLFYNTPARLKFLKSNPQEAGIIGELVSEYALGNANIAFKFISDGKTLLQTSGNGEIKEVLAEIWGKQIAANLTEKEEENNGIALKAFFSPITMQRGNRRQQLFFVNGRLVKNPILHTALEQPYRGALPHKRYPIGLIYISLPPSETDVNVHPAKTLIKFHDERAVFSAIYNIVNSALMAPSMINSILNNQESAAAISQQITPAPESIVPKYNQEVFKELQIFKGYNNHEVGQENSPYQQFKAALPFLREDEPSKKLFPKLKSCGVFKNSYILAEDGDSLYIIDQHAAHERVLFENILDKLALEKTYAQVLLEPIIVDFSLNDALLAQEFLPFLNRSGFDITHFGDTSYLVRSAPSYLAGSDLNEILVDIMHEINDNKEKSRQKLLAEKLACKAAVKVHHALTTSEIDQLLYDLSACEEPYRCPHGRPTIIEIDDLQIQKWFKRIL